MTGTRRMQLREDVALDLIYDDQTAHGSAVTGLIDRLLQKTCASLRAVVARDGIAGLQRQADRWMPEIMGPRALGALYERPERLREACLYPRADKVRPVALRVRGPGTHGPQRAVIELSARARAALGPWLSAWQSGATRPRAPEAAPVWDRLEGAGALEPARAPRQPLREDGVTLIGHATVAVKAQGAQLLFDPFLLPPSPEDPPGARPHTAHDLRPDAVFITHSHPDHFDPVTLMRMGHARTIYVPVVPRESLLATDMVYRLRELGCTDVRPMAWGDVARVGPFRVHALPFFGEQPTAARVLHPEARNFGNTYVVEGLGRRIAMIADAGDDAAGRTVDMAARARRELGPVDMLFGGYRAWRLQPIRYLFSSVARYLLLVPHELRTSWQQIMNGADEFVATGEAWGARAIVPYANGGAPWYARVGLGPRGDASARRADDPDIDPPVDFVARALASRRAAAALHDMAVGSCAPIFASA